MTAIPANARLLVRERSRHRCERCGGKGGHWHHRRGRAVIDDHTHCPCNGVWLCGTCHDWAHHNPIAARDAGFIVSRYIAEPGTIPIKTPWGLRTHTCSGGVNYDVVTY